MSGTIDAVDLDACLPQTQCGRCGYPRCIDYAAAVANGEANINRCPPGGEETIAALAKRLGTTSISLAPEVGPHRPPRLANIREPDCIGCTLCIQACPVDAIIGASKLMHTVISDECTGCELCVPVCPMDCIELYPDERNIGTDSDWRWFDSARVRRARQRSQANQRRVEQRRQKTIRTRLPDTVEQDQMRREIQHAVKRVRQRRNERQRQSKITTRFPVSVK